MFDRFAIVGAYYLYAAMFYSLGSHRRNYSRALNSFSPGLTLTRALVAATRAPRSANVYGQALPKNDDYQATRDAYARLLVRARRALRAEMEGAR